MELHRVKGAQRQKWEMLSECPLRSIFPPSQAEKPPDQSCRFVVDSLQIDKRQLRESGKITGGSSLFWVRGDWKKIAEKKELIRFRRRERINQCKHVKTKLHVRLSWILMAACDPESQCSTLYTHRAIWITFMSSIIRASTRFDRYAATFVKLERDIHLEPGWKQLGNIIWLLRMAVAVTYRRSIAIRVRNRHRPDILIWFIFDKICFNDEINYSSWTL